MALSPSFGAVLTGMVYQAFPYTVLVLYPAVARLDPSLVEAARTLGASPLRAFFNLVVPTLRNALLATFIMVFVFALGSYLLPQLLGRPQHWTLSVLITDQAIYQSNMPFAAAMAVFLVLVSLALVGSLCRRSACIVARMSGADPSRVIGPGFASLHPGYGRPLLRCCVALFLAAPIVIVAGVSVNAAEDAAFPPVGLLARLVRPDRRRSGLAERASSPPSSSPLLSAALAVAIAFPLVWSQWRRHAPLGADLPGARAHALHPAAGHHGARLPLLLGDARLLRRSRGRW